MKVIKKTQEYVVYQKGSGRYAVKDADKNWVNGEEKVKVLLAEGLIKAVMPAAPVVEEAPWLKKPQLLKKQLWLKRLQLSRKRQWLKKQL